MAGHAASLSTLPATGGEEVPFLGAGAVLILGGLGALATRKAGARDDDRLA